MPILPDPHVAALAIAAIACLPELADSPEPLRAAAHLLGWGDADGSDWWDITMDEIG